MTLYRTFLLGTLACASLPAQVVPSTQPQVAPVPTGTPLTLEQALAMARANSPQLAGASAATAQARASISTARAYSNPLVEVYGGRQYSRPIATPGVPGLLQHYAASQTIEIPHERATRRRAAELTATASQFAQQGTSLSVAADTQHAFYDALKRREEIAHAQENFKLVEDLLRRVTVEVNVGEKGRLELTRATAELARAQFAVTSAQLQYAQAIAQLRATVAAPADQSLEPVGTLEARIPLPALAELRTAVLRAHPALKEAETLRSAASASLENERALRVPRPIAFAEFENQPDLRYWRTGVSIPLPFFDRRRGQVEAAKAQVQRADAVSQQRTVELNAALERAYEQYQLADQQTTTLEGEPLRAAESAVEAARAAYKFGERGIVEVLDAQRVLQGVRGDLLDSQFARQAALVDLEELGAVNAPQGTRP